MLKTSWILFCIFLLTNCGVEEQVNRPNILLIIADDLGYSDLGSYGGEIKTPNIDGLSKEGILFTRYHSSPFCAPTRVMLFSGNDNHVAGMGVQGDRHNAWGYENAISDRVAIIPEVLGKYGYHTYIAGKWHIGFEEDKIPAARGFEKSFVNLAGAGTHYDDLPFSPGYERSPYYEDDTEVEFPAGNYTTDLFTDKIIGYLEEDKDDGKPFFAAVTYTSPHWPLQVDEEYWNEYRGRYNEGYEVLRSERLENLKQIGFIPEEAVLPPVHPRVIPWDSLTNDQKAIESRKMELYSGMVANLDHNVGRLISYLKGSGKYENTLIIFVSDNGAAAEDFYYHPFFREHLQEHFNNDLENMGSPSSFVSYGPQWAEAGSAPFRYFKGYTTEGGLIAPMIISGPLVNDHGRIWPGFATLQDMAPTIYDFAGAQYPEKYKGKKVYPLKGRSMKDLLEGQSENVHNENDVFAVEHRNFVQVRKGNWKLVNIESPLKEENFALYDVSVDLAEVNDLREEYPEIFADLLAEWNNYKDESRVIVPFPNN